MIERKGEEGEGGGKRKGGEKGEGEKGRGKEKERGREKRGEGKGGRKKKKERRRRRKKKKRGRNRRRKTQGERRKGRIYHESTIVMAESESMDMKLMTCVYCSMIEVLIGEGVLHHWMRIQENTMITQQGMILKTGTMLMTMTSGIIMKMSMGSSFLITV